MVKSFVEESKIAIEAEFIERSKEDKSLAQTILNYAERQKDIDLIMIMTQKETALIDLFLGSAAQDIIAHSKIPVMTIIPKQLGFISIFS